MTPLRLYPFAFRLAAAVALTLTARAADITWVGNTSINWADSNWSGAHNPPIANDDLIFGAAGTAGAILNNNLAASIQFNESPSTPARARSLSTGMESRLVVLSPTTVRTSRRSTCPLR
jgi:hypothetical protein